MIIVAIFFPRTYGSLGDIDSSKIPANQPGCAECLIFASGGMWLEWLPRDRAAVGLDDLTSQRSLRLTTS
jgi:hypothetical protein